MTPGTAIAATETGASNGRLVLVLHGFTGDHTTMADVVAPLAAADFRVVAVDLIGHGASPSPPDLAAYAMGACVTQLGDLLGSLGIDHADVVGYSMGARVALSLACAKPDLVRSLVTIGGTAGIAAGAERDDRVAADEALANRIEAEPLERFVGEWMAKPIFATQTCLSPDRLEAARRQRLSNNPLGLANSLRGMGTGAMPPLHEALGRLTTPTLVMAGELDPKFVTIGRDLADRLPNGSFCEVAGAGHAVHLERPAETAAAIIEFLVP